MSNEVKLFVYDLSMGMAKQLSLGFVGKQFDGIWHTGIVVFGYEYFFGGGICRMAPGMTPYGTPVSRLDLGKTSKSQSEFEDFLKVLGKDRFRPENYNLFERNCNNFTDECSQFLLNKNIPDYILNLPSEFFETPIGQMMRGTFDQMMGGQRPTGNYVDFNKEEPTGFNDKDKQIFTFNKISLSQVLKKLQSTAKELLKDEDIKNIENLVNEPSKNLNLVSNISSLFKNLIEKIPEKEIFPVLDLLRFIILDEKALNLFIKEENGVFDSVWKLLTQKVTMPTQLMILRIICNFFGKFDSKISSNLIYLLNEKRFMTIVDFISESLSSENEGIRNTASSLSSNISLYFPKDNLSDADTQLLCSIIEYLPKEKVEEIQFKILLTLYRILDINQSSRELTKSLGIDISKISTKNKDSEKLIYSIKKQL